ncbi:MAG: hypothetical protein NT124_04530 [Candidatus Dependentiae bacterium]|nr:hypothetical protein [Candidatus Dependentiae bacterium]
MKLIKKITSAIDSLNTKNFYLYSGIFVGIVFMLHAAILFNHYTIINELTKNIDAINELREEKVQPLLARTKNVRKQKEQVDALLAQDPDFKLEGYIKDQLASLHLKPQTQQPSQTVREEKYLETIVNIKLVDITTQQIAQFLEIIEGNQRIKLNSIEIVKSKKKPNTIEVSLTVAALQPKELGK